jgi:hypothetical protein
MQRLFLLVAASMLPVQAGQVLVRAGTLINCTLSEPAFSSASAQLGDPTLCDVRPFRRPGQSMLGRGFYLVGRLSDFRDPGRFVGKGWIQFEFDRMVSANEEIPIDAKVVAVRGYSVDAEGRIRGKGHPKRDLLGWLFPFLWPIKVVTLPMRGPMPVMKGEVHLTLRLLDDIAVPVEEPRQTAALAQPQPATQAAAEPARRTFPANPDLRPLPAFAEPSTPPPPISGWRRLGSQPVDTEWRKFGSRPDIQ